MTNSELQKKQFITLAKNI